MYTPEQIAAVTGAPLANVRRSWPGIAGALAIFGINTHMVRIGAIATIARETGVFLPIEEEGGQDYYVRELGSAEAGYHGRGFLQITWSYNYRTYGGKLGLDLIDHPELALQPDVAAKILCLYFIDRGIPALCEAGNWGGVQVAVNGGWINWGTFIGVVQRLLATPEPADAPPVTTVASLGPLYRGPSTDSGHAIDAQRKPVLLQPGWEVHFCPDPAPGPNHGREATPHWAHVRVGDGPVHGWFQRAYLQTSYAT